MPAINVAKTDTFEIQRQKINQIGSAVFNITQGGSDLSTGNLKLGDGTRESPSLAFVSDSTLGFYKPTLKTIGIVSDTKKVIDFSSSEIYSFKDFILQKKILTTNGITVSDSGSNYDPGIYTNIGLLGGTGDGAIASISVGSFSGTVTNQGSNYIPGSYSSIPTTGGSGTSSIISFTVDGITGSIQNSGSGYPPGTFYNVPLTGGSGTGAVADISITGNSTITGTISSPGSGYTNNTYSNVQFLNTPTSTFVVSTITNPGVSPPAQIYRINGNNQQTLNLLKGNTYKFDLSDPSVSGHPLIFESSTGGDLNSNYYTVISKGIPGSPGSCVYLIIDISAPTGLIRYDCSVHNNMGGTINVSSGSIGRYGKSLTGEIVISSGSISGITFSSTGEKYKVNDTLEIYSGDVGGTGSGFIYTINSIVFNGSVQDITITSIGTNYLTNDNLSFNNSTVGGSGSGFQYRISSQPGKIRNLNFSTKGSGYLINETLSISGDPVSGVSTSLRGELSNVSATLNNSSPIVSLVSTAGIVAGMTVTNTGINDTGFVSSNTTVLSVDSLTQITLSNNPASSGAATLYFRSVGNLNEITVPSTTGILVGSVVSKTSGSGVLADNTTVTGVNSSTNVLTLSSNPTTAGNVVLEFSKPYGSPSTDFEYTINSLGSVEFVTILDGGTGYSNNDILSVNPLDLTQPIQKNVTVKNVQVVTFNQTISSNYFQVNDNIEYLPNGATTPLVAKVYGKKTSGSNLVHLIVDPIGLLPGVSIVKQGQTTQYTVNTATFTDKFFIDDVVTPNLTLYVGDTYQFNISDSSNTGHNFSLSEFRDGIWGPSYIQDVSTTLSASSNQIIVSDTTGILPGMEVTVQIGSGAGVLQTSTKVSSVPNTTTIILDKTPSISGSVLLSFRGVEYTTGVEKSSTNIKLKVLSSTPNLYYYCSSHADEGGSDLEESLLTINQNNPKIFGSNLEILVSSVDSTDIVSANIQTGELTSESFTGSSANITDIVSSNIITDDLESENLTISNINSGTTGTINLVSSNLNLNSLVSIGNVSISNFTGNINTIGEIKTSGSLNISDKLSVTNSTISSIGSNDILLSPSTGRIARVNSNTALVIPSGSTSERPVSLAQSGAIRFNTTTNQYEGYSGTTSSWSSLGGIRDLDGNTYITAEFSIGSNDNTLWFYNDNINTVKFTPEYQEFLSVKKVRSLNTSTPAYVNWTANSPVTTGQYLKYRNNLYEVVSGGTTGTSGNEPLDTTGNNFSNGTSTLRFFVSAVGPLTFEEISELRIDPLGGTPLSINSDLRLANNTISTDINDLLIQPNTGKKVTINTNTSLVLPVGTTNERGNPIRGSVRFNTTISQYEGYDGSNWSSLGGVRDVDGNTYIVPELSAGSNENILYFYNNGSNTLRVTSNQIELDSIDTISSTTSGTLNLEASLIGINNFSASIDTSSTSTFISTTKDNLDLGLSSGLTNDPLLRLSDTGDIYYNLGFGSGVYDGVKIFDNELKELEIADYKISTTKVDLNKGTINSGSAILYDPALHTSSKVQIIAHNITTGDKEFVEYSVIDKGTDIFFTDFGNIKTGAELISCLFDFNANNNVRVTFTLDTAVSSGNLVEVTVISNIIKR